MIRIIVRVDDAVMPVNVTGGSVDTKFRTFDVEIPELETYIKAAEGKYSHANVLGVEIVQRANHETAK